MYRIISADDGTEFSHWQTAGAAISMCQNGGTVMAADVVDTNGQIIASNWVWQDGQRVVAVPHESFGFHA